MIPSITNEVRIHTTIKRTESRDKMVWVAYDSILLEVTVRKCHAGWPCGTAMAVPEAALTPTGNSATRVIMTH